jgi:hypothetical protein
LLSDTATDPGLGVLTINVPQGSNTATFYLQSLASTGSGTYTVSSPVSLSATGTVTFTPSGVVVAGPSGFRFDFATVGVSETYTVSMAQLNPNDNSFVQVQQLASGSQPVTVTLASSVPSVATITSPVTINPGSTSGTATFNPLASGETFISITEPVAGYTTPSNDTSLPAFVN